MEESQQSPRSPTSHAIADNGEGETYHETRRRGEEENKIAGIADIARPTPSRATTAPSWGPVSPKSGRAKAYC
jgi:hypothetical protein